MADRKGSPELEQPDEPGQGDIAPQAQDEGVNRNDDTEGDVAAGKDQAPGPGEGRGPVSPRTIIPPPD